VTKKQITNKYNDFFKNIHGAFPQTINSDVVSNHWLYTIKLLNQPEVRKYLLEHNIEVRPLWVPMNQLPAFEKDLYVNTQDISDKLYKTCLSLPSSTGLTVEDQQEVITVLQHFYYD
jgi:perosamine synthetase